MKSIALAAALMFFSGSDDTVYGSASKARETLLVYSDGSNNSYVISRMSGDAKTIEYHPMKPKMSSSGIYDGGKAVLSKCFPHFCFQAFPMRTEVVEPQVVDRQQMGVAWVAGPEREIARLGSKDCCPLGHACHSTRRTTYMD